MSNTDVSDIHNKIGQYRAFVEVDPNNPQLLLNLGDLYHSISNFTEAVECYEKSFELNHSPVAQSRLGAIKISQHDFPAAEKIFKRLLHDDTQSSLLYNLALSQYHQKKWDEALNHFQQAVDEGANESACLSHITRCYHHKHDLPQAISYCEKWIEVANDTESRGYMALLESENGNHERARELAYSTIKEDPDNADAGIVVGNFEIEEHDIEQAQKRFNTVLNAHKDHPRALFGLGLTELYLQNHAIAIPLMESAAKLMPTDPGIKLSIGWAKTSLQDLKGAEEIFREVIKIDRNFAEGHGGLAYVLALQGKIDQAKEEMKTALWLDPASFGATASQSVILGYEEGGDKATEFLAAALEQSPGPGQKPVIEHIRTYMTKYGPEQEKKMPSQE